MNSETRDGTLYLSGDITVKTVTASAFAGFGWQCRLKDIRILDLAEVGRADSACRIAAADRPARQRFTGNPQPAPVRTGIG